MTQFGQGILPKIYEDNTVRQFTKTAFTNHLCRALQTVGMVPVISTWPYDALSQDDFPVDEAGEVYIFLFDYPDDGETQTFNINGTLYQPCVCVIMGIGDVNGTANPTRIQNYTIIEPAIRTPGAASLANVRILGTERGATAGGFGAPTSDYATTYVDQAGQEIQKVDWLTYTGSSGTTDTEVLAVSHWFVYLGPGGLGIWVGTGDTADAFGDIISVTFGFGGARIPGRALPVLEDGNLNRINPIVPFYWREDGSGSAVWDTNTASEFFEQFRTKIHGIQTGLKFTTFPVDSWVFNLVNIEYPVFPTYRPHTVPSPVQISTGGGGHILGRVIVVPDSLEGDSGDLYGPVVAEITADAVRPRFEDVFDLPGCRWCDVSAPLGLTTDPNTLLDWYLVPTYNSLGQFAFLVEPNVAGTIVDTLATLNLASQGTDYYNLTGANGWSNVFPTPVTITETGTSSAVWDDTSAADEQTFSVPNQNGTQNYQVQWDIEIDAGDPDDTLYEIQFDAYNRDDPQGGGNNAEGFNPLTLQYFFNGGWETVATIECAGGNAAYVNTEGELSYSLQTYSGYFVAKDTSSATARLRIRWDIQGDVLRTCDGAVGGIRVNKFRYI